MLTAKLLCRPGSLPGDTSLCSVMGRPATPTKPSNSMGATIVDQIVSITCAENCVPKVEEQAMLELPISATPVGNYAATIEAKDGPGSGRVYVSKAQDVVTGMLAKGSALGQDAINKAKTFDVKHRLTANASATVISFDRRVGFSEKITVGISVVNKKVKSMDQ